MSEAHHDEERPPMGDITFLSFDRAPRTADPFDLEPETARRVAAVTLSENVEAHRALDAYDPDAEPGDTLQQRIQRVLTPRLRALTVRVPG